jgi:histidinol phosphatase-like PHP family hydrolase
MREPFLADLHVHSTFSDGNLTVSQLVDLYGERGFGAIAITDHLCDRTTPLGRAAGWLGRTLTASNFPLYRETLKAEALRAWRDYRLVVIPGFEATQNSVFNRRSVA